MSSVAIQTPSAHAVSREAGLVLRPIRGESDAPLIPLAIGRYVIGSGADADVRLDAQGIDARHAVLLVGPQRTVLKAFSRFTWVNDGVVRETSIKPGDRICLGPVEFEVLKGKTKRPREPKAVKSSSRATNVSKAPVRPSLESLSFLPEQALASSEVQEASRRRRQVIAELNGELLSQLSQIVERETVASDRERRILEQSAQLEGRRRILDERHTDFERLRAELSQVEADWRRQSTEISEQAVQLKFEREALDRDRARLAEENARTTWLSQAADERREVLDTREARLEEQRTVLEQRATQLNLQEQRHSAAVAQALVASQTHAEDVQRLGGQKATFQQQSERLNLNREQLDQERTQYESDRDKLFAERAHLAAREVEIAELRRQLHEQQADMVARESALQGRLDEATSQHSASAAFAAQLAGREQALVDQEAALVIERQQLDERKREIDEQHAAWMLERHTLAARANSEEREAAEAAGAEINMLRSQISELQTRLREERRDWERERIELIASVEATPEVAVEAGFSGDHGDLQAEMTALRTELESERTRFEQERNAWEADQDLLLRDRQALEAEWRRLEARTESLCRQEQVATQTDDIAEITPPPIPEQFLAEVEQPEYQADAQAWEDPTPTDEYQSEFSASDAEQEAAWSEPVSEESTCEQYSEYPVEDAVHESAGFESAGFAEEEQPSHQAEFSDPQDAGGGDVLSLRAQLAEMFGIQSRPDQDEPASEHQAYEGFEEPADEAGTSDELQNQASFGDFEEEAPAGAAMEQGFDGSVEQPADEFEEPEADGGKSDEDIMSAYLARLLKKSPEDQEPMTNPVVAVPEPPATDDADATAEVQEEEPQKPTRRLNAEEKETLRANMDSFRELANQQARAAVAKHKSNELKNGVQTVSVAAALIAVVGAILISAEFWTSQSYRIYGLACLAVSGALGVYTVINGMRIRRLKAVAQMTEALAGDEPEPTVEKPE